MWLFGLLFGKIGLLSAFVFKQEKTGRSGAFFLHEKTDFFERIQKPACMARVAVEELGELTEGFSGALFEQPDEFQGAEQILLGGH